MPSTITDRIKGINTSVAVKAPCKVATIANITLSGEQTIDGVGVVSLERVLVMAQTTDSQNGIYTVSTTTWDRAADFDGEDDIVDGTVVNVTNSNIFYVVDSVDFPVIGTDSINFIATDVATTSAAAIEAAAEAAASATQALSFSMDAETSAASSAASATSASSSATTATTQAAAAAASAVTAANYAASLSGTSSDSKAIGTGSRTFNTQAGKQWVTGQRLRAAADVTDYMDGQVSSYSGTSLILIVDLAVGSGTFTSWTISLVGAQGATGPAGPGGAGSGDMLAANNLSDLTNKPTALTNLGGTATGTSLFKTASASAARTTLGVVIGTDVQAFSAKTAAIAALTWAANKILLFTSSSAVSTLDFLDEDDMVSNSATALPSQQSVKAYVDNTAGGAPTGVMHPYAGSSAPAGYLLCGGQAVSRTTYSALFGIISTTYGVGDGSTTFNLPDLRGRAPIGRDDMNGSAANRITNAAVGITGTSLGAAGGEQTHTLVLAEMPAHHHTYLSNGSGSGLSSGVNQNAESTTNNTGNTGSGTAHNNVQPSIILNYIIKT